MALLVALLVGCVTIAWWVVASVWHLVAGS
jgi:hypothetical protein